MVELSCSCQLQQRIEPAEIGEIAFLRPHLPPIVGISNDPQMWQALEFKQFGNPVSALGTVCIDRDALSHHRRPDSVALPACRGRHPHLGVFESGCDQTLRAMVLGASNSWFPLLASALYVPELASEVGLLVEKQWPILQEVTTKDQLAPMLKFVPQLVDLRAYDLDLVWGEVEARHNVAADDDV